jgi:hypothetical protein
MLRNKLGLGGRPRMRRKKQTTNRKSTTAKSLLRHLRLAVKRNEFVFNSIPNTVSLRCVATRPILNELVTLLCDGLQQ